jgi:choline dehydrogenase-like flavoprotein
MNQPESSDEYDYIVVGLGYAGAILTARLAERNPNAKIIAIEYGGPVQAKTGGATNEHADIDMTAAAFQNEGSKPLYTDQSKYDPKSPLCMADVPGNYNNVAFRPLSNGYHLEEFPACFQGTGLGGNGVYNGALYQEPAKWWWNDKVHNDIFVSPEMQALGKQTSDIISPYFKLVRKELKDAIKSTPSMDSIHYNHGLYDLVKPNLLEAGFEEVPLDAFELEAAGKRFFTVPTVNVHEGLRTGSSAWLQKFLTDDGKVRKDKFPNLEVKTYTEVLRVLLDANNVVQGVEVTENVKGAKRGGLKVFPETNSKLYVKKGGKVILGCGALPSNRILYRSGVGPEGESTWFVGSLFFR